ncbi:MAG: two-component sensor histidine kinase, partial [Aeromicrobium sp.]
MDTSAGLLIAGVIGATAGALVTWMWRYSERRETEVPEITHAVPDGAEAVLSVLSSSAVIVDTNDTVLQASAPAVAMGLLRDERLPDELMTLVRQVRRDGQVRE